MALTPDVPWITNRQHPEHGSVSTSQRHRLIRKKGRANDGVVAWLLACPAKGFFVPIESESTDTL